MSEIKSLESILSHSFRDRTLIERALTHSSTVKSSGSAWNSFERLEFLGDRVLGLVIADRLLEVFPNEKEGALAKRHAALVCREKLASIASSINLGGFIVMSEAEKKSGGRTNETILADCIEAVIGAMYKDGGLESARSFISANWEKSIHTDEAPPVDYKSALQEWAQGQGKSMPVYDFIGKTGPDHKPVFTVICRVEGIEPVEASGESKKAAEKKAAEIILSSVKNIKEQK